MILKGKHTIHRISVRLDNSRRSTAALLTLRQLRGLSGAGALATAEKQELAALRRENKELRMEREILR